MLEVIWFRRDLRTHDHPALARAVGQGRAVLPLFIVDPGPWDRLGGPARTYVAGCLSELAADLGGLHIRTGRPAAVLAELASELGPLRVHATEAHTPKGRDRDDRARGALAASGSALVLTGSNYAVPPGTVRKADGSPYRVFTPFHRAWLAAGWPAPVGRPPRIPVVDLPGEALPTAAPARSGEPPTAAPAESAGGPSDQPPLWGGDAAPIPGGRPHPPAGTAQEVPCLPAAGERAALARWATFRDEALPDYPELRDRPDLPATSGLSAALRWGQVHPRTLLAQCDPERDRRFVAELAWREFYADVLFHNPASLTGNLNPAYDRMVHDTGPEADESFRAWALGLTGFPFIDAGMRQLRAEGWMHNRVRMVTASFLVKDLHLPWWRGEREFMRWLVDGDPASNAHGWQWVAGSGTDAAPYHRVFNPVLQGLKFDPRGDYVRRYVPELAHLPGPLAHEPWRVIDGYAHGYPTPIVDHREEREEALRRFAAAR